MIRVGTSGYGYTDWVGTFYPAGTRSPDMLAYYAQRFSTVELNFSYYRMPDERTLSRMAEQVPEAFTFSVKAPGELSHELHLEAAEPFRQALSPLRASGKLAAVLVQFPYRFKNELTSRRYLSELSGRLEGLPTVVEFRHSSWVSDAVRGYLEQLGLGSCSVDMPALKGLLPPVDWVTAPLAYVRFHGRNAAKWWQHDESWERYDYRYSDVELLDWVPRLRAMEAKAQNLLVYMNNHAQGKATADAERLIELLGQAT
jgi:uncharacterized protein YecE (DUF72 family)